jgi:hypothetical protein
VQNLINLIAYLNKIRHKTLTINLCIAMRQTLILTKKQESQLEQILNELMFSLKKTYTL